jgi:hypothetical protein
MRITKNIITRNEALAICPDYVTFVEGDFDKCSGIHDSFQTAHKGQKGITAFCHGVLPVYVRVVVTSVNHNDPRAIDGPLVRVTNGEASWRVDGDKYAYLFHSDAALRTAIKSVQSADQI